VTDSSTLPRRALAEFCGSAFLVAVVVGSGIAAQRLSPNDIGLQLFENAAATAGGLVALILAFGPVSGAHFNPGVTLSFVLTRHFKLQDAVPYVLAQVGGAIAGAALLWALFGDALKKGVTGPSGTDAQAFAMEAVLSFTLMLVIMAVATDTRAVGQAAAIAIGTIVGIDVLIGGPISGGSMNPARSLGPALVSGQLKDVWIYLVSPPLGAVAGAFTYQLIRGDGP